MELTVAIAIAGLAVSVGTFFISKERRWQNDSTNLMDVTTYDLGTTHTNTVKLAQPSFVGTIYSFKI